MIATIRKMANDLVANPKKKLVVIMPELRELRSILARVRESYDPLDDVIIFFNATSRWHDRGIRDIIEAFENANSRDQYNEVLEKLGTLALHFVNAGRCDCGWNRTKHGEAVTADRVFLGDIFGLWTKTVAYWKTCKNDPKDGWAGTTYGNLLKDRNAHDVVSEQAAGFMRSHVKPMIEIINYLESVAA